MLSTFESALLARHLHGCVDCRAFAAGSAAQTQLLRGAELEQPLLQVALPSRRRPVRRIAAGALSTAAAVAAAVSFTLAPSGNQPQTSAAHASSAVQTGAPVFVVVAAQASLGTDETVPRLKMEAASV